MRMIAIFAASMLALTACNGDDDTNETDTDDGTEGTSAPSFDTGLELFGFQIGGDLTGEGESTALTGSTVMYDVVYTDGALGAQGDILCAYTYPTTAAGVSTTQSGFDSSNAAVNLECEGCDFALEPTFSASSAVEGDYCDIWYSEADYASAFPYAPAVSVFGFNPSYDDPTTTDEVETEPATLLFYDGSGENTDDAGAEMPAEWYAVGFTQLEEGQFLLDLPINIYAVYELAYYE